MRLKNPFKITLSCLLCCFLTGKVSAQKAAIKTNILYDATSTFNLGIEFGLSKRWTLDLSGNYNPWTFSNNKKWKHWMIQPEFRYWLCNKMNGHFFGTHLHGGQYNFGNLDMNFKLLGSDFKQLKDYRYEGWFIGTGIAYGYAWIINKHFNIEAEFGFGYTYTQFDKYKCEKCGEKLENRSHNYIGPTKAGVNLVYVF